MVELIYTPTNGVKFILFIHILSRFFNDHYSNWCEMVSQCGLICISLMTSDDQHFSYVYWPHICLLLKSVCAYLSPTFGWVCFFLVNLFLFFVDLDISPLSDG